MKSSHAFWLASTALVAVTALPPMALAAPAETSRSIILAQAPAPGAADVDEQKKKPPGKPGEAVKPPTAPAAPAAPPAAQAKPPAPPAAPPAAEAKPPAPPAAQAPPAAAPAQPPAATAKPPAAAPAPAAQRAPDAAPQRAQQRDEKREEKRGERGERRSPSADDKKTPPPAAKSPAPATPPAAAAPAAPASAPAAQERRAPAPATAQPTAPAAPSAAETPTAPAARSAPTAAQPAAQPPAATAPDAAPTAAAAPPPATQTRDASEFLRGDGQASRRGMDDVRKERRETRDGNRTIIREGDRTIVREGDRTIIRHSESNRFAVGAREVRNDRRGNENVSVIVRPNGVSIVTTTDLNGRLVRRVRRDRNGRDVVIIDNSFAGARRGDVFVNVPPPVYKLPRERYIIDARRASPAQIYDVFVAPPVMEIEERYTVDQVRYSQPLRDRMPRVDLDINFDTGSWQLSREQIDRLSVIAEALNRAIDERPREVFLIEGHTDAVGTDEDNLSLSDRRAETVAIALTEQFQVPPENLITQGYGEEYLKVQTEAAEAANRRVAVRRITPLMAQEMSGR